MDQLKFTSIHCIDALCDICHIRQINGIFRCLKNTPYYPIMEETIICEHCYNTISRRHQFISTDYLYEGVCLLKEFYAEK